MTDLTEIDVPFGELDDKTKGALLLAELNGAGIEFCCVDGVWSVVEPTWEDTGVYRVKRDERVRDTLVYDASMSASVGAYCSIFTGHVSGRVNGSLTVETVDGRPVFAKWEALE